MRAMVTPSGSTCLRAAALLLLAVLAGCASGPRSGRDGAEARPPSNLVAVPDAEPRVEPIRNGGPNKPYEVLGRSYTPLTQDRPVSEKGLASWYGRKFHGRPTASGELYDMYAMTAAHKTLPIPSYARIRNPANGREVIVRINDRGPFHGGRIVDLSYTAALKLGVLGGVAPVELERITFADIRSGAWRRDGGTALAAAPAPTAPTAPADEVPAPRAPSPMIAAAPVAAIPADAPSANDASVVGADAVPVRPMATAGRGFWIQLGAFRQRDGAESFHRRVTAELDWIAPLLGVFDDAALFRLQAGPYPTRDEARAGADRIRDALQLVPVVVERR
jgi:rare lipoprotein A